MHKIEKYFELGAKEQFLKHKILLILNLFLFILTLILVFYYDWNNLMSPNIIIWTEYFFGTIFLIEIIIHLFFILTSNKIFWNYYILLNILVVISFFLPILIGNLAFLRLIQSFQIIEVYIYKKKVKKGIYKK